MHQKARRDPLWASIWEPFGLPKSIPKRSKDRPDGHWIADIDFEGGAPAKAELGCHPEPRPRYSIIYIYIYIYMYISADPFIEGFARCLKLTPP